MTTRQGPPETGSLGEEVLHLFADLAAARRERGGADSAEEPAAAAHRATCSWCPVCQTVDLVREASPEVLEHVGDSLESLAAAVRELTAHLARRREDGTPDEHDDPTGTHVGGRPGARVQPIDLAEDGPWH